MSLSTELSALLDKHSVTDVVKKRLLDIDCTSVSKLANWVDEKKELKVAIMASTSEKDDNASLACIKAAWREAEARANRACKRQAEGLESESIDEPLSSELYASMVRTFMHHNCHTRFFPVWLFPCDSLFGRIHREFEKRSCSFFPLHRVRSLAHTQKGSTHKRSRLTESCILEFSNTGDDTVLSSAASVIEAIEILSNGWAVAGCYKTTYNDPRFGAKEVVYCHFSDVMLYMSGIRRHTNPYFGVIDDATLAAFIISAEEEIRIRAIELSREPHSVPWGQALVVSSEEFEPKWDSRLQVHRTTSRSAPPAQRQQQQQQQQPPPPPRQQQRQLAIMPPPAAVGSRSSRAKWVTSTQLANGSKICKRFNDQRGCAGRCPRGEAHVCDVTLVSGKVCGAKDHGRSTHNEQQHGTAQIRQGGG
jgi:hypothetical protein